MHRHLTLLRTEKVRNAKNRERNRLKRMRSCTRELCRTRVPGLWSPPRQHRFSRAGLATSHRVRDANKTHIATSPARRPRHRGVSPLTCWAMHAYPSVLGVQFAASEASDDFGRSNNTSETTQADFRAPPVSSFNLAIFRVRQASTKIT